MMRRSEHGGARLVCWIASKDEFYNACANTQWLPEDSCARTQQRIQARNRHKIGMGAKQKSCDEMADGGTPSRCAVWLSFCSWTSLFAKDCGSQDGNQNEVNKARCRIMGKTPMAAIGTVGETPGLKVVTAGLLED